MSLDCNMLHASRVGMLYPKNLQTAMEMEAIVRDNGAIPATIAASTDAGGGLDADGSIPTSDK